ncbi:hypothetical protein NLA06_08650 [Desulfomicrobium sp. ZS1]|uniref:hypothetical protein n=1 Tax=Desulfomicrobium sp. ZS1 TaxID=2952228 RepID=UPI0020B3B13D|nr:hypothetical protein [Desulfomicrobium sp. ZS1]UTF48661.1 hypothetical protein NLA06_08650 [Desulfomicrobium sp. ZS1]
MISEKVPRKIQEATFITRRPLSCIARAVMPFLLLRFFCLLMFTYIPIISTLLPAILR